MSLNFIAPAAAWLAAGIVFHAAAGAQEADAETALASALEDGARQTPPQDAAAISTSAVLGLPPREQQVDGLRIGWAVNDSLDAFKRAIADDKPFVLVLFDRDCDACLRQITESFQCLGLNRYAGEAEFAISERLRDPAADEFGRQLKVEGYPIIAFIAPNGETLEEYGRIVGRIAPPEWLAHVEDLMASAGVAAPSIVKARQKLADAKLARPPVGCLGE